MMKKLLLGLAVGFFAGQGLFAADTQQGGTATPKPSPTKMQWALQKAELVAAGVCDYCALCNHSVAEHLQGVIEQPGHYEEGMTCCSATGVLWGLYEWFSLGGSEVYDIAFPGACCAVGLYDVLRNKSQGLQFCAKHTQAVARRLEPRCKDCAAKLRTWAAPKPKPMSDGDGKKAN